MEELGEFLYFDEDLSDPAGQSCASCHDPAFGFVDPDAHLPVSAEVIPGLFGGRNSPSSAYANTPLSVTLTTLKGYGSAASSGIAGPPAKGWAIRWPAKR